MLTVKHTMNSREIAELIGKPHADLMKAIRAMEDSWTKVNGGTFSLVEYLDAKGERRPMYQLTKLECLYVATKFNDEARAKLILRWEELELLQKQQQAIDLTNPDTILTIVQNWKKAEDDRQRLQLTTEIQQKELSEAAPKVEYYNEVMQSESLIPTNIIAKELGMSAVSLNKLLNQLNIIYRSGETWVLYHKYQNKGYTGTKTVTYQDSLDNKRTAVHTYWTELGREFIHQVVKEYSKQKIAS